MKRISIFILVTVLVVGLMVGCSSSNDEVEPQEAIVEETEISGEVNLYTNRHYDTDEALYDAFEEETGIKVNVVKGDSDELIERLDREGEDTQADLLITADAGRLHRAKEKGLLQSIESSKLTENIPENLRDTDNEWTALTVRGRVIVYAKDRVDPNELSDYMSLTDEKWANEILVRSSSNIYNQSLLASIIEIHGEEKAREWAQGIVENMARTPKGNDRAQATAVVAGEGDLAIMNTYYIGKMINSSNEEEVKVAENVGIYFPEKTHINISGVGLTKHAKNQENAVQLIEYLTAEKAQSEYATANYEYPANPTVKASDLLNSWGTFESQGIDLTTLGINNEKAVKIFNEVGWE